jgi:hypothetical protein
VGPSRETGRQAKQVAQEILRGLLEEKASTSPHPQTEHYRMIRDFPAHPGRRLDVLLGSWEDCPASRFRGRAVNGASFFARVLTRPFWVA